MIKENLFALGIFGSIIVVTFLIAFLVNRFFNRLIKRSTVDMNNDPTTYQFLRHVITAMIYIVGVGVAIYSVPSLRTLASTLLAGAGVMAMAIAFASQQALSNVVGGVFVIIFKPFRINDRLKIRELQGIVEDITLRHTVLRDFENKRIVIPNSVISDEVIVNSDFIEDKLCKFIDVGISYDSDIDKAKEIMRDEVMKHPLHVDPRTPEQLANGDPEVTVRVIMLGDSSVNLRAWAWAKNSPDGFILMCDLIESIKKRFDVEGVEIPFPHRTVVYKDKVEQEI